MVMTADTTALDYWLNWRFSLCLVWVLSCIALASYLIWKYEGLNSLKDEDGNTQEETNWSLYADEAWMPCIRRIHPAWLLAFRVFGFLMLLAMILADVIVDGITVLTYYTQWTFVSVTIYFGLGCLLSIYGCCQYSDRVGHDYVALDAERGAYEPLTHVENGDAHITEKRKYVQPIGQHSTRQTAGIWGYVFQILFQMNAGAVILTDCVFWFIIYPFLTANDDSLTVMKVITHSVNAVFLIGDTTLNCVKFPWFRIAYFILWTGAFVIFQWVFHACASVPWPYPILELSSSYAPLWYMAVGMMHLPCYGFFYVLLKMKGYFLSKYSHHTFNYDNI